MGGCSALRPTLKDIYNELNTFAPFDTAEEWDNIGMLTGRPDHICGKVLIALDFCQGVLTECLDGGYDALVTHHPVMFRAIKELREDNMVTSALCGLIRADIGLIASHTCLDRAAHGVAQTLADMIGMNDIQPISDGFGRVGRIAPIAPTDFVGKIGRILKTEPKIYTRTERPASKCAVCPGSGSSFWRDALQAGAEIYLTGEAGLHDIMDALENGLTVITAGHRETEIPVLDVICAHLRERAESLGWDCEFKLSSYKPYF